jgi:MFS family permease
MDDTGAAERARKAGRSILSGSQRAGRVGASVARGTGRFVHRLSGASGASRTGFSHLLELTAAGGFGDAFVAIALAGSLFFSTSVEEARGRAAVALLVTIAPYAILAPLIGPLLDKVRQGNKFILMGTLLARGLLCWGMSSEGNDVLMLLPAAFGVLVLQKAYVVTRAAVTPRLLPSEITLVTANARSNLASLIATTTGAAVALGVDKIMGGGSQGAAWVLRVATVIYLVAMIPGLRLPDTVDVPASAPGPDQQGNGAGPDGSGASASPADRAAWPGGQGNGRSDRRTATYGTPFPGDPFGATVPGAASRNATIPLGKAAGRRRPFFIPRVGPVVGEAMRANASMRAFYGFLLFFLVFILRGSTCKSTLVSAAHHAATHHAATVCGQFGHVSDTVALGGFAAAAAIGGMLGTVIGSALRSRWPQFMIFTVLALATAASIACAIFFSLASILIVTMAAAISQTLVKVAQDSILQREIPEEARSSAFAFSETVNQLALVGGGLVGLLWSLTGSGFAGLTFAAACLAIALVWLLARRRRRIVHTRPTVAGSPAASTFRSPAGS